MAETISVGRLKQRDRLASALFQLVHAGGDLGRVDLGLADLVDACDEERVARRNSSSESAVLAARDTR